MAAFVTRVAVDPSELTHSVTVGLPADELVRLRGVLVRIVNADLLNVVTSASVSGQAFMYFDGDENDRLANGVAICGSDKVAVPIDSFFTERATIVLQDDFEDEVFRVFVREDEDEDGPLEVVVATSPGDDGETYELNVADARVYRDVVGKAAPSPAQCLATIHRPRTSARCVNAERMVYQLPAWYGNVFLAFLSRELRLHVLARASLPDEPPVPLSLIDGGRCTRAVVGTDASAPPVLRCTIQFHQASMGCICGLHSASRDVPHFRCVQLTMQTCGNRCLAGHAGCGLHRRAPQPTSSIAARACLGDAKLTMRCMHRTEEDNKVHPFTTVPLPVGSPFLAALSAASVDLVEPNDPPAPDRIKDALCTAFRSDVASRSGRVSEEELLRRDEIALSLLAEGKHFFGLSGARGRSAALRLRDNPQAAVEAYLRNVTPTHGHLLPRK